MNQLGWRWLQVQVDGFTNIFKHFFACLALRPTTLQRRTMSDEIAVFSRFNDHLQRHGRKLTDAAIVVNPTSVAPL
jgi:hypothetical protein